MIHIVTNILHFTSYIKVHYSFVLTVAAVIEIKRRNQYSTKITGRTNTLQNICYPEENMVAITVLQIRQDANITAKIF